MTPWIALGVIFQGIYLVGSIGLVITKQTTWYPIATGIAAAVSLAANGVLISRYGLMGAAWANALAYATLALVTVVFSQRVYPIAYEWSRLIRIVVAGVVGYAAARAVAPEPSNAVIGLLVHGTVAAAGYAAVLFVTGFFHAGEIRMLREVRARVLSRARPAAREPEPTDVEMAGEIVAAAPEPERAAMAMDERKNQEPEVSRGSRAPES